jgi:amino acid adenylation domain-containing protein
MSTVAQRAEELSPVKRALLAVEEMQAKLDAVEQARTEPIAIIGMGCRFPGGADSPEAFWQLLKAGADVITEVPVERWDIDALYHPDPATPGKMNTRWGGFLKDIDAFDASFFGISPREAARMDPQQRLLLEVAWEALEAAGQTRERLAGSASGVFVGVCTSDYSWLQFADPTEIDAYTGTGTSLSLLAGRLSYLLDWQGPSITLDTACSSSLVAVHLACQSLRNNECQLALASGVNLILAPFTTICTSQMRMMAADGRCKTFDARADGFVRGEGCGVIVLKRLSAALKDGDPILALVRGSAVNQDGRTVSLTAPSGRSQQAVIRQALQNARVKPEQIGYVEAHGTGTSLGDPIEFEALASVVGAPGRDAQPCAVGSVKTNIGHAEASAGIAGLIKTVLALRYEAIPPNLHLRTLNPNISLESTRFTIPAELVPWSAGQERRFAGVSSFGWAGTNAHVILEEAPAQTDPAHVEQNRARAYLVPLSAQSDTGLRTLAQAYLTTYAPDAATLHPSLADLAYTAATRRTHHDQRLALVVRDYGDLADQLTAFLHDEPHPGLSHAVRSPHAPKRLVFVFPGQGGQWPGMARQLLATDATFRTTIEQIDQALQPFVDWSLLSVLQADPPDVLLERIDVIQPCLFAMELGLAAVYRAWGVVPDAVIGHSMGEVAAAVVAGALSLQDGARVIAIRSQLLRHLSGHGAMAVVELPIEAARVALHGYAEQLSVAASNSPTTTVVSGDGAALDALLGEWQRQGVFCRRIQVDVASHSPQVEPLCGEVRQALANIQPHAGSIPIASTVTATLSDGSGYDAAYWARNLREPVLFSPMVQQLITDGHTLFVELSPHPTLTSAVQEGLRQAGVDGLAVAPLRRQAADRAALLGGLGALYCQGAVNDWRHLYPVGRTVALPTYPWQHERFWHGPDKAATRDLPHQRWRNVGDPAQHPLLGRRVTLAHPEQYHVWETELDLHQLAYLDDHRVQGAAVLPGTGYVEIALAAAAEVFGHGPRYLGDITFKHLLFLSSESPRTLQVILTPNAHGEVSFQIYSRPAGDGAAPNADWTLHATGIIQQEWIEGSKPVVDSIEVDTVQARCMETIASSDFYEEFGERGNEWGPSFQGIAQLWRGEREALGELRVPEALERDLGRYRIHPAVLDACLQVLGATVGLETAGEPDAFVPIHIDEIRVYSYPSGTRLWSHATLHPKSDQHANTFEGDVRLYNETGHLAVEFLRLRGQAIDRDAQLAPASPDEWLYELQWQPYARQGRLTETSAARPATHGTWLLFADHAGVGAAMATRLETAGERCILVDSGEAYAQLSETHFALCQDRLEDLPRLLDAIQAPGLEACRGIIHLWSLDAPPTDQLDADSLERAQAGSSGSVVALIQALARAGGPTLPRLWLVTRGAQPVGERKRPLAVAQAPLWGLGRAIPLEHPDLWGGMIDLDPSTPLGVCAEQLWETVIQPDGQDQVAFRDDQRYVARLSRAARPTRPATQLCFRPDASYVITGGLGDLGLVVARWMVEQGARHLVLMGRTPLPPRATWESEQPERVEGQIAAVCELEALGARVSLASVDVADETRLRAFLAAFHDDGEPPIRGLVHAAGVVEIQPLLDLDQATLRAVLRPKLTGSWLLHHVLADEPLDFFVLFSSASALLSSPLLASYAAANTFLDALAHERRAQGLPAVSINWGFWSDVGMAARHQSSGRESASRGMGSFTPAQGLQALECLLAENPVQVAVMPIDWRQWRRYYPTAAQAPLLADIMRESGVANTHMRGLSRTEALSKDALLAAEPDERRRLVEGYLRNQVAHALKLPDSRLDSEQPLNMLGLDSLMAVELRNGIEGDLGMTIPIIAFLQGPSVADLSTQLLDQLQEGDAASGHAQKRAGEAALPTIIPDHDRRCEPFPLNDIQQAYWIGRNDFVELGNVAAHIYLELESANLDLERLNAAWQQVVDRHDMLRAVVLPDGQQQVLAQVPPYQIERLDLRGLEPDVVQVWLENVREQLSHQVLETDQWPLFEIRASQLDGERTRLHISFDILIADVWSLRTIFREWASYYQELDATLPALDLTFRDYVLAESTLHNSDVYQQALSYWQQRLPELPPAPDLPLAVAPDTLAQPRFVRHSARLEPDMWRRLKERARSTGLTSSGILLAAFADVIATWSKNPRFTINVTLFNRLPLHPQVNDIVGDFTSVNMLAVDASTHDSFENRARRLQQQLWQDLEHRQVSGVRVVRELLRTQGGAPRAVMPIVFTSTLATTYTNSEEAFPIDWLGDMVYSISQTPQVWLDHQVFEHKGALVFNWDVVDRLFPEGMLQDMFETYCRYLEQLALEEERWQMAERPLLPPVQLAQRAAVNATQAPVPEGLLHTLVATQVHKQPEHPALVSNTRTLTYDELYRRANQIGRCLRDLDVRPNTLVAVVMEKGWEQVVAVMGILTAGAAYLPIDSSLPKERVWYLLENGQVDVVLTQPWLDTSLEWPAHIRRLQVDERPVPEEDGQPLMPIPGSEDLAYVIFTSGSTGRPKGVMIDHRGAVNTIVDLNQRFAVGPQDRVLALSNLNFDLSVYDIFGTLAAGGTIVMPDNASRRDPAHWADLLIREQVTIWNSVPALMQMLVEYLGERPALCESPASLRLVMLSGDWVPVAVPNRIQALFGGVDLYSLGGATEASIWSILYPIRHVDPTWKSIPYGQPMVNQTFHVLNEGFEACPVWVPGQLYIGGIGLAKGYWRDEAKTNASFIIHPRTGERLYRTGDLGRYLPDGNIEFLGREDFQVKIRGHRIELGEIETALEQHPGVQAAVAAAVGDPRGDKRLIAYVVPDQSASDTLVVAEWIDPQEAAQRWHAQESAGQRQAQNDSAGGDPAAFACFAEQLDELHLSAVCTALRSLGVYAQPNEQYTVDEVLLRCGIQPRYYAWVRRNLALLAAKGLLQCNGDRYQNMQPLPADLPDDVVDAIGSTAQQALGFEPREVELLAGVAQHLPNFLTEAMHSAQIYTAAEMPQIYQKGFDYCNRIVREVVRTLVDEWPHERPLRVLEIGAGFGSTTSYVLPVLPPDCTSYDYTDVSQFFLQNAQRTFDAYPFLRYGLLDIEEDLQVQGYEPHSFDVVIAASVLHATRDIAQSVAHAQALLAPGGVLLLVEETHFHSAFDLSMGLQQGFDRFEDCERRQDHPLLAREAWQRLLLDQGFERAAIFHKPGTIPDFLGFDVVFAQGPTVVQRVDKEALRHFVRQKLPEYMVPSGIVVLDALPLTPQGKVDRKALANRDQTELGVTSAVYVAPQSEVERALAGLWQEVLQVEQVGMHDNFFELGGDSLLITRLASRIRNIFEIELPLPILFERSNLGQMAEAIEQTLHAEPASTIQLAVVSFEHGPA